MSYDNMVRLQKYIADCGVASRRKAEELILHNKVMVNHKIVNEMGIKVDLSKDIVTVEGKEIKQVTKKIYIALNKPAGYITTTDDEHDRPKVLDLVDIDERIFPVGRLDYDTSGLLILTNDGDIANKIMHPKFQIAKTYIVNVLGVPSFAKLDKLRAGIYIDDYKTSPAEVNIIKTTNKSAIFEITIHEGKNRQVRKMFEAVGHTVIKLQRISLGDIKLGRLKEGHWRHLNKEEIEYLKRL